MNIVDHTGVRRLKMRWITLLPDGTNTFTVESFKTDKTLRYVLYHSHVAVVLDLDGPSLA